MSRNDIVKTDGSINYNYLGDSIDGLSSQMADNMNDLLQRRINLMSYGVKSLDIDANFDCSNILQQAINDCSKVSDDLYHTTDGGGEVFLPAGKYMLHGVILHSKVKLRGVRGATWIIPNPAYDDYALKTNLYNDTSRHEAISIEDIGFTSSPSSPITATYTSGQVGSGIYLGSGNGATSLRNITIFGLDKGIKLQNEFDTELDGIEILKCNRNLIMTTSTAEVTNAVDLYKLRTELGVTSNLEIYDENPNVKMQVRSIQFNGGKFEQGKIFVKGARDIKFNNANFVWSSTDYMIQINATPTEVTLNPDVTSQTDMINFNNCSFQNPFSTGGKFIDNRTSTFPVLLICCSYVNLDTDAFIGNILVIGGTIISANKKSFTVPYMTGVVKTNGSDPTVAIRANGYITDNVFNILYNTDDLVKDTTFKLNKTYINTGGRSLVLNLMMRFNATSYSTAYELILNGNSMGILNGAVTGTTQDKQFSFIIPPGNTFKFLGDTSTETVIASNVYYI
ncbi:hypothetical protein ACFHWD_16950 [Clostridium sp. MT-14]|uniref:hypothetical protein n=1 Tax=Clostridium sp. MT-14 TaxID=3348360 RepID=UPI0035F42370